MIYTVLLTDGYTEGKLLIISVGVKVPIARSNGKVKQIVLEQSDK